jgi:hypothetical protein
MQNSAFTSAVIVTFVALVPACASAPDPNPTDQEIQAALSLTAEVTTVALKKKQGSCAVDGTFLQVRTPTPSVDAVINGELVRTFEGLIANADCTKSLNQATAMTVVHNGKGILSILESGDSFSETSGVSNVSFQSMNFDLRTGKRLELNDIVNVAGKKKLAEACTKAYAAEGFDASYCAIEADASFTLTRVGVRFLQLQGARETITLGTEGQLVEWTSLAENITNPLVKGLAR